jgi:hypothetical protein
LRQSSRNQTGFSSLGIAENTVRLPLVKVDNSLAVRIDEFVQKSVKKDKRSFFKQKIYFEVAKLITKFATKLGMILR